MDRDCVGTRLKLTNDVGSVSRSRFHLDNEPLLVAVPMKQCNQVWPLRSLLKGVATITIDAQSR